MRAKRKHMKTNETAQVASVRIESGIEPIQRIATTGRNNANAAKPVSLAPLSFEDALQNLLKVAPAKKQRGNLR